MPIPQVPVASASSGHPHSLQDTTYLPLQIWNTDWIASPRPWYGQITYQTMTSFAYSKVVEDSPNIRFKISGSDSADIADQYLK